MTNNTNDNFWLALSQFVSPESNPITHRLYYDQLGDPLFYSMEDLPGNYVKVTPEMFSIGATNCRVVDGKLIVFKTAADPHKLTPSDTGTACHPQDVCIVVDEFVPHTKWSLK
jgi:hypothetical protein